MATPNQWRERLERPEGTTDGGQPSEMVDGGACRSPGRRSRRRRDPPCTFEQRRHGLPPDWRAPRLVGGAPLERGASRRHPPRSPGAHRARQQSLSHVGCHVGRLGCLRRDRDGRASSRNSRVRRTSRRRVRRQSATRRSACSMRATSTRSGRRRRSPSSTSSWRTCATRSTCRRPTVIPRPRSGTGSRSDPRCRHDGRCERGRGICVPGVRPSQSGTHRECFGNRASRSQPVATAPDREHDLAERDSARERHAGVHRSALGLRRRLRPSPAGDAGLPVDPGEPPYLGDSATDQEFKDSAVEVVGYSSLLDPGRGVIDRHLSRPRSEPTPSGPTTATGTMRIRPPGWPTNPTW